MSVLSEVRKDISRVNILSYFEIRELPHILLEDERIEGVISGFYSVGPAMLCITNERVLLVDKKFIRLIVKDMRFDSLSEIQFSQQLFLASVELPFAGETLQFRTWYTKELRAFVHHVQSMTLKEDAKEHVANISPDAGGSQPSSSQSLVRSGKDPTMGERLQKWHKVTEFIGRMSLAR